MATELHGKGSVLLLAQRLLSAVKRVL